MAFKFLESMLPIAKSTSSKGIISTMRECNQIELGRHSAAMT